MINKFDLNQELVELAFEKGVFDEHVNNSLIKGFYNCHRLGSRVPLFLFGFTQFDLGVTFTDNKETLNYFSKLGNVLCFEFKEIEGNLNNTLHYVLKKYGSIYTIVFCFDEKASEMLTRSVFDSPFLQSEIKAYVEPRDCSFVINPVQDIFDLATSSRQNDESSKLHTITDNSCNSIQLRNAKILQFMQETFKDECIDWNWQFEQSDKLFLRGQLVMKNLEKWKATEASGTIVEGTSFIPMKLMHDGDSLHNPLAVLEKFNDVGMVVDLSNDEGSYDKTPLLERNIKYQRMQLASKIVPSSKDITTFIDLASSFIASNPCKKIIVHCHYGFNRTGLMICAYMIAKQNISVSEALGRFKKARPPGIKHQNYIDKLYLRYEGTKERE